jgi:hypothetical protein
MAIVGPFAWIPSFGSSDFSVFVYATYLNANMSNTVAVSTSVPGGKAEDVCWYRVFLSLIRSGLATA